MLNPLKIATDGYLKRGTKAVLIIAVAGYLSVGSSRSMAPSPLVGRNQGGGIPVNNEKESRKESKDDLFIIEFLKVVTDIINNQ